MKRRNLISDINVVPYIDVMLVLLVIFMISAPLMVQGIQVNLPEATSEALPVKNNEPLIVSIKKDGSLFLETDSTKGKPLNLEEMRNAVSKIFGHNIVQNYRQAYNIYCVSGILFNHESPLRGDEFVTKKIVSGLTQIYKGKNKILELGKRGQ